MASLLERRLIIVTGKGGTGKTTVACALGLLGARRGLRTAVVELGGHRHLAALCGLTDGDETRAGEETRMQERLWSVSIDSDRAMFEWLAALTGRVPAHMLTASSTFQYFAAAAPGAKELVTMRKLLELCDGSSRRSNADDSERPHRYDLVVLDAPATGHALGMLRSPQTFSAIARVGPMAEQTERVRRMLDDPARCAYVAVSHASEMAVAETLELEQELRHLLGRDLDAVFVNGTLPQRFTAEEIASLERLAGTESETRGAAGVQRDTADTEVGAAEGTPDDMLVRAAVRSAQAAYRRERFQQTQVARLRRQRFAHGSPPKVFTIPFQFVPELDLAAVEAIAQRLGRTVR